MKALGINGSHRRGGHTSKMLDLVLEVIQTADVETELLELTEFNIRRCVACNRCLRNPECSIQDDDMALLAEKMEAADAIIIGSPVYFCSVTSLLKTFMDRTRWMHMHRNPLDGKIGAALTHAALRNGGQELTQIVIERFLLAHGLYVVEARENGFPRYNLGPMGTLFDSLEGDTIRWKKGPLDDELTVRMCRILGRKILEKLDI